MKSITIHGLDERLSKKIDEKAKKQGLSLNKTIKKLLEESLGIKPQTRQDHKDEFMEFCGIWSDEEAKDFEAVIEDFEKTDSEDWM